MPRYMLKSLFALFAVATVAAIEIFLLSHSNFILDHLLFDWNFGILYRPSTALLWLILGAFVGIVIFLPLKKSPVYGAAIGTTISFCLALHLLGAV